MKKMDSAAKAAAINQIVFFVFYFFVSVGVFYVLLCAALSMCIRAKLKMKQGWFHDKIVKALLGLDVSCSRVRAVIK